MMAAVSTLMIPPFRTKRLASSSPTRIEHVIENTREISTGDVIWIFSDVGHDHHLRLLFSLQSLWLQLLPLRLHLRTAVNLPRHRCTDGLQLRLQAERL